jgi:hypothetical protein
MLKFDVSWIEECSMHDSSKSIGSDPLVYGANVSWLSLFWERENGDSFVSIAWYPCQETLISILIRLKRIMESNLPSKAGRKSKVVPSLQKQ